MALEKGPAGVPAAGPQRTRRITVRGLRPSQELPRCTCRRGGVLGPAGNAGRSVAFIPAGARRPGAYFRMFGAFTICERESHLDPFQGELDPVMRTMPWRVKFGLCQK